MSDEPRAGQPVTPGEQLAPDDRPSQETRTAEDDPVLRGVARAPARTPPLARLADGTQVGPFVVLSMIGRGGMGEVYRARDSRLGRDVAIKLLRVRVGDGDEALPRFAREARLAGALNHPNVLALFDVGEFEGVPYIVTELLEGQTLRGAMSSGPLAEQHALEHARQIAAGLAAAHSKGIVHRDLKPENLFVTREGITKILDFGLAKLLTPEPEAPSTTTGTVVGTPSYMSPEQLRGEAATSASDIFSFGITLAEMLSGKHPFAGKTSAQTAAAILASDPQPLPPPISQRTAEIVRRCLHRRPIDRFPSAVELVGALWGDPSSGRLRQRGRRGVRVVLMASALLLGALVFSWVRRHPEAPPSGPGPGDREAFAVWVEHLQASPEVTPQGSKVGGAIAEALRGTAALRLSDAPATADWVLGGSVEQVEGGLRVTTHLESPNKTSSPSLSFLFRADELETLLPELALRERDEVVRLIRERQQRERAERQTHSAEALRRLLDYYDLMGASPRLEFYQRGRELLTGALAADPRYVAARVALARLTRAGASRDGEDVPSTLRTARTEAEAALAADPLDAPANLELCSILGWQFDDLPSDADLELAMKACAAAAQSDKKDDEALYRLAKVLDHACEESRVLPTLRLALERQRSFDRSREGQVLLYMVTNAMETKRFDEADAIDAALLQHELLEDRFAQLSSTRAREKRPAFGGHLLRASLALQRGQLEIAESELNAELQRGARLGGLPEWIEAASLRGIDRLLQLRGATIDSPRRQRLEQIETRAEANNGAGTSLPMLAGAYAYTDPPASAKWLRKSQATLSCNDAVQEAGILRFTGKKPSAETLQRACATAPASSRRWLDRCTRNLFP